jgi:hypothetical protein
VWFSGLGSSGREEGRYWSGEHVSLCSVVMCREGHRQYEGEGDLYIVFTRWG